MQKNSNEALSESDIAQLNEGLSLSPAFYKAAGIRALKQRDYGSLYDYFPFGAKSYCHELHKKTKRLVNLNQTDITPNCESIQDNLIDLINYASYYYEFILQEDKNGTSQNVHGSGDQYSSKNTTTWHPNQASDRSNSTDEHRSETCIS